MVPVPAGQDRDLRRWALIVVGLVTLIGALPRLFDLGGPSLWNDEAASSLFALAALKSGLPVLPHQAAAIRLVNFDPLYAELEAASFWLLGVGQFSARIAAAVFGILTIPVSYLFGRRLNGHYVGIALAVMVSFSTEFIAWSRQARGYSLFTLLLLGTALVLVYPSSQPRADRRWIGLLAGLGLAVLCVLSAPGLTLLYGPGVVSGVVAFYVWRHRSRLVQWMSLGDRPSGASSSRTDSAVWLRRVLPLVILGAVALVAIFPPKVLVSGLSGLFQAALGYPPYRFVPISQYATYLLSYYAAITYLATFGAVVVVAGRRETEIALLAFLVGSVLSLSTLLSFAVNHAGGAPIYERYLTPLLVFLFYFAARGLVWIATWAWHAVPALRRLGLTRPARTVVFALGVAALLIIPSAVVPTGENTYRLTNFSPAGSLVPWVPFTPWPAQPSALYGTPQPNFAHAAAYVLAHRLPGDVAMAIWPEAPTFYLGAVQYWIYYTPPAGSAVPVPGGFEYYLTGSVLVSNVTQLETALGTAAGWLFIDTNAVGALGTNLSIAVNALLTPVSAASDGSISLFHWNRSSTVGLLLDLRAQRPDLRLDFAGNLTALIDWAAVYGVTSDLDRVVLLPIESALTNQTSASVKPLAVLVSVFNQRPDLQPRFPEVLSANFTGLLDWAVQVVTGAIADPAAPILAPYASYYQAAA